ncbi:BcABA3 [Podospora didyma]|uniref:BcABA3 n=1 Tax=Podospora didyma TaxID=330526 RepID=A0AAE0NUQ2_9PEZI|nr:BcABA3 [Podospora didyma]
MASSSHLATSYSEPISNTNHLKPTLDVLSKTATVGHQQTKHKDLWFFPNELQNDLQGVSLLPNVIAEVIACAWEYVRCVIPQYTNRPRYIAFCRIIIIGVIAEFRGSLVDITSPSPIILGYDLDSLLSIVYGSSSQIHEAMAREYKTFILITADKANKSRRIHSELFHRYTNALARSPETWFRLRDCDALARFTIAAALTCNDHDSFWFSEDEINMLCEIADAMYDAASYYKHRAEGETNNTFAYAGGDMRQETYRQCREVLWELDCAWADSPPHRCVLNFMRSFGGPIHIMMRRYRYVEDGLTVGREETDAVVAQTRKNFKLWNRVTDDEFGTLGKSGKQRRERSRETKERYDAAIVRKTELMFDGLAEILEASEEVHCGSCQYRNVTEAERIGLFGGVQLCEECRTTWRVYLQGISKRASEPGYSYLVT